MIDHLHTDVNDDRKELSVHNDTLSEAERSLDDLYNSLAAEEKKSDKDTPKQKDIYFEDSQSQVVLSYPSVFSNRRLSFNGVPTSPYRKNQLGSFSSSTPRHESTDATSTPKRDRSGSDNLEMTNKVSRHASPAETPAQ